MAGASDRYRSSLVICSQRVCSHSRMDIALVTVDSVSFEKTCCVPVISCSMMNDSIEGLGNNMTIEHTHTCKTSWTSSSCFHSAFENLKSEYWRPFESLGTSSLSSARQVNF